jgi:predicted DNA-binding transcriptional regulator AlpA
MTGPDVLGAGQFAKLLQVSRARFYELKDTDARFPDSTMVGQQHVWDGPEARAYAKDRGRPDPQRTKLLQSYRKTRSVTRAARTAEVPRTTAYRWLEELRERMADETP